MSDAGAAIQKIDKLTLVGLVLLLAPLLTVVHEVGGHGGACLATGGAIKEIGAHYLDCASTSEANARLVSLAGAGIDVLVGALAWLCWRAVHNPLLRTTLWMVAIDKLLLAAGYPLFSGVMNVGDFSVGAARSLGALSPVWAWRVGFILLGLASYIAVVILAIRMLHSMLGGSAITTMAQRQIPMTLYVVSGVVTLLAAIPNPIGPFIVFTSAAASFGGLAGLFNVAYQPPSAAEPKTFLIARNWPLIGAGIAATAVFVLLFGPSIHLA
ncbi:MAG TPA: hypothetical protein VGE65_06940 [Sphingobium sp.]